MKTREKNALNVDDMIFALQVVFTRLKKRKYTAKFLKYISIIFPQKCIKLKVEISKEEKTLKLVDIILEPIIVFYLTKRRKIY